MKVFLSLVIALFFFFGATSFVSAVSDSFVEQRESKILLLDEFQGKIESGQHDDVLSSSVKNDLLRKIDRARMLLNSTDQWNEDANMKVANDLISEIHKTLSNATTGKGKYDSLTASRQDLRMEILNEYESDLKNNVYKTNVEMRQTIQSLIDRAKKKVEAISYDPNWDKVVSGGKIYEPSEERWMSIDKDIDVISQKMEKERIKYEQSTALQKPGIGEKRKTQVHFLQELEDILTFFPNSYKGASDIAREQTISQVESFRNSLGMVGRITSNTSNKAISELIYNTMRKIDPNEISFLAERDPSSAKKARQTVLQELSYNLQTGNYPSASAEKTEYLLQEVAKASALLETINQDSDISQWTDVTGMILDISTKMRSQ